MTHRMHPFTGGYGERKTPFLDDQSKIGRAAPRTQSPAESKKPAEIDSPFESKKIVPSPGEKKAGEKVVSEKGDIPSASAEKTAGSTPTLSVATRSPLKISGIIWHEESSKRLAVISGMITLKGLLSRE